MFDQPLSLEYVMNVIMVIIKIDVSYVIVMGHLMHITANNARSWKKIGMGVRRLLTWDQRGLINFMRERNMDSQRK
jgi:hypothetical protein